jgi:hypothetical protein
MSRPIRSARTILATKNMRIRPSTMDPTYWFRTARERGRHFAQDTWGSIDSLPSLDAALYAGCSAGTLDARRRRGAVYAVVRPDAPLEMRYPRWQFDARSRRLEAALRPFVRAGANCWVIHSFMAQPRGHLDGKAPAVVILDSTENIARVVDLAVRDIAGEQGAT